MSNVLTPNALVDTLNALAADREQWENGVFKQSNEALYLLLDRCVTLFGQISGNRTLIKQLNTVLIERDNTVRTNTSLATKIVRFVFGECGKRAYTYARVISVASDDKPENQSMNAYITTRGGIEAIRKGLSYGEVSVTQANKLYAQAAVEHFDVSPAVVSNFSTDETLRPASSASHKFVAALIRAEANGGFSIVFSSTNERLVQSLLIEGGKSKLKTDVISNLSLETAVKRDARDRMLSGIAA